MSYELTPSSFTRRGKLRGPHHILHAGKFGIKRNNQKLEIAPTIVTLGFSIAVVVSILFQGHAQRFPSAELKVL